MNRRLARVKLKAIRDDSCNLLVSRGTGRVKSIAPSNRLAGILQKQFEVSFCYVRAQRAPYVGEENWAGFGSGSSWCGWSGGSFESHRRIGRFLRILAERRFLRLELVQLPVPGQLLHAALLTAPEQQRPQARLASTSALMRGEPRRQAWGNR